MLALVVGVALCHPLWAAARTTYKWLDQSGNVTYGDYPPTGSAAQPIRISTGTSTASTADAPPAAIAADRQQAVAAADTRASGLSAEKAAELCQQARTNLEILQSHALIRQTDADGKVHILDDATKQEQIATAGDIIKAHCR